MVVGSAGARQHGDSSHAAIETDLLLHADCSACDFEVAVAERNAVQALDNGVDDVGIFVLAEGDALLYSC